MKKYGNLLMLLVLVAGLSGCSRSSQVNIPVPTAQDVPGASALVKNIPMTDRATFQGVAFEYMSDNLSNLYHKVPIGNYLLADLLASLPKEMSVTSMKLQRFSGKCIAVGMYDPQTQCDVAVIVSVEVDGVSKVVSTRLGESAGPWISSFGSNYLNATVRGEGQMIVRQIRQLLKPLVKSFAEKLKAQSS